MGINKTGGIVRLAIGLVMLLGGAGLSHAVLIDDFNDGNDDGWRHLSNVPGTWDASSQEYVLASVGPTQGTLASAWEASIDDPHFNNGFLRGTVRVNTVTTNETAAWLAIRAREMGGAPYSGYIFGPSVTGESFFLWEVNPSDPNPIEMILNNPSIPVDPGEDWILEAGAVGNQLSLKVWRPGEPEPAEPQWTVVDTTPIATGAIGVGLNNNTDPGSGEISATFDDIYFRVPEPASGLLLLLGTLVCSVRLLARGRV